MWHSGLSSVVLKAAQVIAVAWVQSLAQEPPHAAGMPPPPNSITLNCPEKPYFLDLKLYFLHLFGRM